MEMPKLIRAIIGVSAMCVVAAGSASAQEDRYAGEWTGKYVCGQGVTALRLVITATGGGGARAVAHFFPTPENSRVPEGCFTATGLFEKTSGQLSLRKERWIMRPRNYVMTDFDGTVDADGKNLSGRLSGVQGCASFSLTRDPVDRPMPPACEAGAR
jgi:hypothetical protein